MDQIIDSKTFLQIKKGTKTLEDNEFFRDLSTLMTNDTFVRFFSKHMSNWIDVRSSVTYMKLYKEFQDRYEELTTEKLDKSIVVFMMCQIMRDRKLRPLSIKTIDDIYNLEKKDLFSEFQKSIGEPDLNMALIDASS